MRTDECEHNFLTLKEQLTSVLVLSLPNDRDDFVVYSDVSSICLGCLLMQRGSSIAYASKQLKVHERIS